MKDFIFGELRVIAVGTAFYLGGMEAGDDNHWLAFAALIVGYVLLESLFVDRWDDITLWRVATKRLSLNPGTKILIEAHPSTGAEIHVKAVKEEPR